MEALISADVTKEPVTSDDLELATVTKTEPPEDQEVIPIIPQYSNENLEVTASDDKICPPITYDANTGVEDAHHELVDNKSAEKEPVPDGCYGWFIVLGCFISHIVIGGLERSTGIYFLQFKSQFNKSAQLTAWPDALVSALRLFFGPIAGMISNRYSVRSACLVGSIFLFLGLFLNSQAPNFYFLFLSHFLIQGIGRGLIYAPGLIIVGMYFDKRRGLATGLSSSGVGIGTFAFLPLSQFLFDTYGTFDAFMIIAALAFNTAISAMLYRPLSLHYKFTRGKQKTKTDKISLQESLVVTNAIKAADNQSIRSWKAFHTSKQDISNTNDKSVIKPNTFYKHRTTKKESWLKSSLKICFPIEKTTKNNAKKRKLFNFQLLKKTPFLLFCVGITFITAAFKSAFTFIPALVKSLGYTETEAAFVMSITGIIDTIGRISFGFLFDIPVIKRRRHMIYTGIVFCIAGTSVILSRVTRYAVICLISSCYAFLTGGFISQKAVITVDMVGVENIANSFGLLICFQGIGMIFGPPLSGALMDLTGSYRWTFLVGGGFMASAACLMVASNIFLIKQQRREKQDQARD